MFNKISLAFSAPNEAYGIWKDETGGIEIRGCGGESYMKPRGSSLMEKIIG